MLHILCVRTQELFTFLHRALALESTEDYGRMDMAGFHVGKQKFIRLRWPAGWNTVSCLIWSAGSKTGFKKGVEFAVGQCFNVVYL